MATTTPSTRSAVWAESGQTTAPSQGEQQAGYVAGKPSRRKTNWLLNWIDNAVQWLLGLGLPLYDNAATYVPHSRVQDASGYSWQRIGTDTTTGVAPGSDAAKWERWGHTAGQVNDAAAVVADAHITTALGTLSGALGSGVAADTGAVTVSSIFQFTFPSTTRKLLIFHAAIGTVVGGSITFTLSGDAAFSTGIQSAVPHPQSTSIFTNTILTKGTNTFIVQIENSMFECDFWLLG